MAQSIDNDGTVEYFQQSAPKRKTVYRVYLAGNASSFESEDELVAAEYARLSKAQGWKTAELRKVEI